MFGTVKMIAILIIVLVIAGGLWYVTGLKADLAISEANNAKLEESVHQQQELMQQIEKINDRHRHITFGGHVLLALHRNRGLLFPCRDAGMVRRSGGITRLSDRDCAGDADPGRSGPSRRQTSALAFPRTSREEDYRGNFDIIRLGGVFY